MKDRGEGWSRSS